MSLICAHCDEEITGRPEMIPHIDGDGLTERYYHRACRQRLIIGGLNHLLGRCTCCGGAEPPDPPEMTRRQAAIAAVNAWHEGQVDE
jgi:hypothetical protein